MSAGPYSIGSRIWPGLSKLTEEMGEVQQILGKIIATGGKSQHWDGSDLRARLQEELADLLAACEWFGSVNGFFEDPDFDARIESKIEQYASWHEEQADFARCGGPHRYPRRAVKDGLCLSCENLDRMITKMGEGIRASQEGGSDA